MCSPTLGLSTTVLTPAAVRTFGIADPGALEEQRRLQGAHRQDDLLAGIHVARDALPVDPDAGCAFTVVQEVAGRRVAHECQVGTLLDRMEVRLRGADAEPVLDGRGDVADPFVVAAVEVLDACDAHRFEAGDEVL
jgi:hypothetical protein